jgi:hypothetical protein
MAKYFVALPDEVKQQLVSKCWGKLSKIICFFEAMLLFKRRPLHTRNWQIFTLKFWNTQPTHLILPHQTTTSFLTCRNT